ncbi:MAG: ribosome biogenesis GTPase Der, partial [Armatimonadetes bacterium]|nr:ribosome biogenesis GTPase Der [Candidatus Hippobium faecium]
IEDQVGVTRDRMYAESDWNGVEFAVVDTGGIIFENEDDPLIKSVTVQAQAAVDEADVIVFCVDAKSGIHPLDYEVANKLRFCNKPVILAANKADNEIREWDSAEFYELGFENIIPISALNGRCVADLLDEAINAVPEGNRDPFPEDYIKIAVVGRPNVGKSSMINAISGKDRVIVSDVAGTTRDAVDTVIDWRDDQKLVFVDTAGIRKAGKVQGSLEYYMVLRAIRAMERADVAMIIIDGDQGLRDGDKRVAGLAHESGRACMIVVNKWDLCNEVSMKQYADQIRKEIPYMDYAPIVFTSALTKKGIAPAIDTAIDICQNHAMRISTGELNKILQDAVDEHPYSRKGKELRIRYATMVDVKPPKIVISVNHVDLCHFSYRRYLENKIREKYSYEGTPIKMIFRAAKKEHKNS